MPFINVPVRVPQAVQATIATLAALGSAGTSILHAWAGFLPVTWSVTITSGLAAIAAVAGFLQKVEPLIEDV